MANATSFQVEQKPRKRRLSTKQKATSLYQLWHGIQDIKADAEPSKPTAPPNPALSRAHGAALSSADTARPN